MDDASTWELIHAERAATVDALAALTPDQWSQASLCGGGTVEVMAGHFVQGAEQSTGSFMKGCWPTGSASTIFVRGFAVALQDGRIDDAQFVETGGSETERYSGQGSSPHLGHDPLRHQCRRRPPGSSPRKVAAGGSSTRTHPATLGIAWSQWPFTKGWTRCGAAMGTPTSWWGREHGGLASSTLSHDDHRGVGHGNDFMPQETILGCGVEQGF